MPTGSLYPAGGCQLRKESDDHAPSLPSAAPEGKPRIAVFLWESGFGAGIRAQKNLPLTP
jgi:hypothetical protein